MVEEIKEILKEHTKEVKRHIDVVKEDFDSKFDLLVDIEIIRTCLASLGRILIR